MKIQNCLWPYAKLLCMYVTIYLPTNWFTNTLNIQLIFAYLGTFGKIKYIFWIGKLFSAHIIWIRSITIELQRFAN